MGGWRHHGGVVDVSSSDQFTRSEVSRCGRAEKDNDNWTVLRVGAEMNVRLGTTLLRRLLDEYDF